MSITRESGYPGEYAQLMAAFNQAADGHTPICVLNASLQMLSAAIGVMAKAQSQSLEEAEQYTGYIASQLLASVKDNYQRKPQPSDVAVKQQ